MLTNCYCRHSPINDNSSESGSESTSPESSSEESNNGSTKIESATTENNKWSLHSFIKPDVQTKATAAVTQPTLLDNQQQQQHQSQQQQSQQPITNIKNEPMPIIDEEPSTYTSQHSLSSQKGVFHHQNNKIVFDVAKTHSVNNFDVSMEQIKQEPLGKF